MKTEILYIDMDNVLVNFPSAFKKLNKEKLKEYKGRLDEVPGIFSLMEPLKGAKEAFDVLAAEYDTYILSTAPWENPSAWSDMLLWVKTHLGNAAYKRLILSQHKNLNAGKFLIDDRTKNGAGEFGGEHIHFGTDKFPDWKTVVRYMKQKKGELPVGEKVQY